MSNSTYLLTASEILNEWILTNKRLCIATKRALNSLPYYIWFENGMSMDGKKTPLTHVLVDELTNCVDIAWIGDETAQAFGFVTLHDDGSIVIETAEADLTNHYPSYER